MYVLMITLLTTDWHEIGSGAVSSVLLWRERISLKVYRVLLISYTVQTLPEN